MPFCPNCGKQTPDEARFCINCGSGLHGQTQMKMGLSELNEPDEPVMHSQQFAEMSRLSRVGVEKFLAPGERIIHSTPGMISYANQKRHAYVTNKRVLFYARNGLVIKNDRMDEVFLGQIRRLKLVEQGMISKHVYLELDEMKLEGSRSHLLDLYRAVQTARAAS